MELKKIGTLSGRQDGAIWGDFLFHVSKRSECCVYKLSELENGKPIDEFTLDKADLICPHNNSVFFGCEYYEEGDEFPLLYTNVYNTYQKDDERHEGECCVYRILRDGDSFSSRLVQLIKIGFTERVDLWKSFEGNGDVRPYGNFAADRECGRLYAFVMRDAAEKTRIFSFDLPKLCEGVFDKSLGVIVKVLEQKDIIEYFDTDYMRYIQGACVHCGKLYSLEGFTESEKNPPAIRIINLAKKSEELLVLFESLGSVIEPEFVDFWNEKCYYIDSRGNAYNIEF